MDGSVESKHGENTNSAYPPTVRIDKLANLAILFTMAKKYQQSNSIPRSVQELPAVSATALKNTTADVLDRVIREGAVAITRHDKPQAILISLEEYLAHTGQGDDSWLTELREECQTMLEEMQSPEQKAAADKLFTATSEELGAAAVRGAQNKGNQYR